MTSPAERFAAFRERQALERAVGDAATTLRTFEDQLSFGLDDFQREACTHLAAGSDVLVAAPTGAGKTVVGEFAVHLALAAGRKAFYTTPIKALSNQKHLDLAAVHGPDRVGLLTGDVSINAEADVVVMTTEVLRNMIYARSPMLANLGYVVMDEVHYLADADRGAVWEEVILLLEEQVRLVSLSATVSNAEEFGQWLSEVRGATAVVVSERRPVPLWQHMMVRHEILDLYAAHVDATDPGTNPPVNPELLEAVRRATRSQPAGRERGRLPHQGRGRGGRGGDAGATVRPPRRDTVVERLDAAGLLPAIVFVFSRAGCEAAVDQVLASGIRLTADAERREIAEVLHELSERIPGEDLQAVNFTAFASAATRGVAAHHAGLLPLFKQAVEHLFTRGLIKVVFATETLALGVNMPARSVVIEKLTKWDGRSHAPVTPGEYTQLTGRAGRRGIDVEGHAVVLYTSGVDPSAVAGLASRRTYPLRSSFRPTYNMAVNLLAGSPRARVRDILEQSFAQFQADAGVVHLARQVRRHEEGLAGYREAMACDRGDTAAYLDLRARISELEATGQRERSGERRRRVAQQLEALRPGDVIEIPRGRRSGHAVVVDRGTPALEGPRPQVLTSERQVVTIGWAEVPHGLRVVGRVKIPKTFTARDPRARRDLASSLRNAIAAGVGAGSNPVHPSAGDERELAQARAELRRHPVHACPDREDHLRWARRAESLERERDDLARRIANRTTSIAKDFDRVCEVLARFDYLTLTDSEAQVTSAGQWLRRLYCERDLVLAEVLHSGECERLDAAELAALATTFVYRSRSEEDATQTGRGLTNRLADAVAQVVRLAARVEEVERETGLTPSSPVDAGLVGTMFAWARGASLTDVLGASGLGAGDLVRWCRQVLDVLDQIAVTAPTPTLRHRAREAMALVRRGVVGQELE